MTSHKSLKLVALLMEKSFHTRLSDGTLFVDSGASPFTDTLFPFWTGLSGRSRSRNAVSDIEELRLKRKISSAACVNGLSAEMLLKEVFQPVHTWLVTICLTIGMRISGPCRLKLIYHRKRFYRSVCSDLRYQAASGGCPAVPPGDRPLRRSQVSAMLDVGCRRFVGPINGDGTVRRCAAVPIAADEREQAKPTFPELLRVVFRRAVFLRGKQELVGEIYGDSTLCPFLARIIGTRERAAMVSSPF